MKRSAWQFSIAITLASVGGCSKSAPVDDTALSNSEAAAMVAEETAQATPAVFNAEGAPTVAFSVPDMMCEHACVPAVRDVLAKQPGVKDVKVELESKTATVAIDESEFDAEAAVAALVDKQFKETRLVTAEAAEAHGDANPEEQPKG
jgi:copper chaperone CopZ